MTVLTMKAMGINDLLNFDFMDPPPAQVGPWLFFCVFFTFTGKGPLVGSIPVPRAFPNPVSHPLCAVYVSGRSFTAFAISAAGLLSPRWARGAVHCICWSAPWPPYFRTLRICSLPVYDTHT